MPVSKSGHVLSDIWPLIYAYVSIIEDTSEGDINWFNGYQWFDIDVVVISDKILFQ